MQNFGPHDEKRARFDNILLDQLPNSDQYETSLMHRDTVNFCFVTCTDFLITTSIDGHIKFWKKSDGCVDFVKHFRTHLGPITAATVSHDGSLFASASSDKTIKIFDVINFDMINMFTIDYIPSSISYIYPKGNSRALIACSDKETGLIHVYDARGDKEVVKTVKLHSATVNLIRYNQRMNTIVSSDITGGLEYWCLDLESENGYKDSKETTFKFKAGTDLYDFKKNRTFPTSLEFSPNFKYFVTYESKGRIIRLFEFKSGNILKRIDESLTLTSELQQKSMLAIKLDDMEFGRRLAVERELESSNLNVIFDESGKYLLYSTLIGIKIVNIKTDKIDFVVGTQENLRFIHIALYQGAPKRKTVVTIEMAASENVVLKDSEETDPTLFCTAFKKSRFYSFSRREPDTTTTSGVGRDIFNEKPSREEQALNASTNLQKEVTTSCIIHTTLGDIYLKLYPDLAPKAVLNFMTHSKTGYYDNVIFHRIIKGFMIQTGDPLGDGTGGESIWDKDFEDEFNPNLRHDKPYVVCMANAGPNTNGSQFFITTAATPWLDDKHTIFGRCTGGLDVVHRIETGKTDRHDRLEDMVRISGIEMRDVL